MFDHVGVQANVLTLYLFSKLNLIPFDVDLGSWKIEPYSNKNRLIIWKGIYAIVIIYTCYPCCRIGHLILTGQFNETNVILALYAICSLFILCLQTCLCYKWPYLTAVIFNEICKKTQNGAGPKKGKKYSMQYLLLLSLPPIPFNFVLIKCVTFSLYPNNAAFLYSLLNAELQNGITFWMCMFLEIIIWFLFTPITQLSLFMQLSLFEEVFSTVDETTEMLGRSDGEDGNRAKSCRSSLTIGHIHSSLEVCRRLRLLTQLFNHNFSYVTFSTKQACISSSIMCLFFALKYLRESPIFAMNNMVAGSECVLLFVIVYDKAFGVPEKIEQFQRNISLASRQVRQCALTDLAIIDRELCAVTNPGIKVGSFQYFENTSTLEFVDYVLSNVISLKIAYP